MIHDREAFWSACSYTLCAVTWIELPTAFGWLLAPLLLIVAMLDIVRATMKPEKPYDTSKIV